MRLSRVAPDQLARAHRLLAQEGAAGSALESATAAGRVLDKLHQALDPVLGEAGVRALLARSVKLAQPAYPCLADPDVADSSTQLRGCLQAQAGEPALGAAAALFASFFSLLIAFIGEPLAVQMLRNHWPAVFEGPSRKSKP